MALDTDPKLFLAAIESTEDNLREDRFDVASSLKKVSAPVVLVASRANGLVPFENSRKLAAMLPRPARWIENDRLAHNGLLIGIARAGCLTAALDIIVRANGRMPPIANGSIELM